MYLWSLLINIVDFHRVRPSDLEPINTLRRISKLKIDCTFLFVTQNLTRRTFVWNTINVLFYITTHDFSFKPSWSHRRWSHTHNLQHLLFSHSVLSVYFIFLGRLSLTCINKSLNVHEVTSPLCPILSLFHS